MTGQDKTIPKKKKITKTTQTLTQRQQGTKSDNIKESKAQNLQCHNLRNYKTNHGSWWTTITATSVKPIGHFQIQLYTNQTSHPTTRMKEIKKRTELPISEKYRYNLSTSESESIMMNNYHCNFYKNLLDTWTLPTQLYTNHTSRPTNRMKKIK